MRKIVLGLALTISSIASSQPVGTVIMQVKTAPAAGQLCQLGDIPRWVVPTGGIYTCQNIVGTQGTWGVAAVAAQAPLFLQFTAFGSASSISSTTSYQYQGGQDGFFTGTLGSGIIRGANQTASTSTGLANSVAGGAMLKGGTQTSAAPTAQGGSTIVVPGTAPNAALSGLALYAQAYQKGSGTHAVGALQCSDATTAQTADDCGASPVNILGVVHSVTGNVVQVFTVPSVAPVLASAAVTLGDTVCAGTTATQVTDSGGTGVCSTGILAGIVTAISGSWTLPDGTTFTATTTLPLVQMK